MHCSSRAVESVTTVDGSAGPPVLGLQFCVRIICWKPLLPNFLHVNAPLLFFSTDVGASYPTPPYNSLPYKHRRVGDGLSSPTQNGSRGSDTITSLLREVGASWAPAPRESSCPLLCWGHFPSPAKGREEGSHCGTLRGFPGPPGARHSFFIVFGNFSNIRNNIWAFGLKCKAQHN